MERIPEEIPPACRRILALAQRDPRRAERLARRARERALAGPAAAWPGYALGWALLWWERFDEARTQLWAARQRFLAHDRQLAVLRCDYALLLADLFQHASPGLDEQLDALAEQFAQAGAPADAALARLYQAGLLNVFGRSVEAEAVLDQIAGDLAGSRADGARLLYIRGSAAILRGDYARADALLAQAEQVFAELRSPLDRAKCQFQTAWSALRQERLELAFEGYRSAERIFARLDLPMRLAFSAKNIGLLLTRLGRYDQALGALLRALRSFTQLDRAADIGSCQLNLGNIYYYVGQWEIALAYYRRAEALYARAGVVGERVIARRNSAMVYRAQGRHADAHALLLEAEAEARAIDDQHEVAVIALELAGLLADAGHAEAAMHQYSLARDRCAAVGNQLGIADSAMEQGWLALRRGQADAARELFQQAAPLVAQHPYNQWRVEHGLARCAEARGDATGALAHYRAANLIVAGLRARLASEAASSSISTQAEELLADSLRLAVALGAADDLVAFSELQRAVTIQRRLAASAFVPSDDYRGRLEMLQQQIAGLIEHEDAQTATAVDRALAEYGDLLLHAWHDAPAAATDLAPEAPFDLAQLRAQLNQAYGDGWTALSYSLLGETLLIGIVTPEALTIAQTPYDEKLRRSIERIADPTFRVYYYRDLAYRQGRAGEPWAALRELAGRLLPRAVQERLGPAHHLLIAPTGSLHMLPWPALRLERGWLAEQAIVQLTPSLTVWQSLANRPASQSASALLIGCSTFGARAPTLRAVGEELASVAASWPGDTTELSEERATRAALLRLSAAGELMAYRLVHIASHAQLLTRRGLAGHVKLWDGDLWLPEIARLRLAGALITLSTCEGALADPLPGEENLSLSWAFLAAGAGAVLASLWPVDDQVTRNFIEAFYRALQEHGDAGLALALAQRAQVARFEETGDLLCEPLGWGSFVISGASRAYE